MILFKNTIVVSEYEKVYYDDLRSKLKIQNVDHFKYQIDKINQKLKTEVIRLNWNSFQAKNFVGFVKLKKINIQIIPKIFEVENKEGVIENINFLLYMFNFLRLDLWNIKQHQIGLLRKTNWDMFEFYIYFFSKNLNDLLKKGVMRSYEILNANENTLKGRLLIKKQIQHNSIQKWRYFCEYEELTENNLINQILKYCTVVLLKQTSIETNKKLLKEILSYFFNVEFRIIRLEDFRKINFDRTNSIFKPYIDFCEMVVRHCNLGLSPEDISSFYFLFNMNKLFEAFLSEFIASHKNQIKIRGKYAITSVNGQFNKYSIGKLFNKFNLNPDLILSYQASDFYAGDNKNEEFLMIDFKYKILDTKKRSLGVSKADIYQMFTYSQSQDFKYKDIVLFYPKRELEKLEIDKYYKHSSKDNQVNLFIKALDLKKVFVSDRSKSVLENLKLWEINLINSLNEIFLLK